MTFDGVDVKLYEPRSRQSERRPGLVYFHGGGWTMGSAGTSYPVAGFCIVSVSSVFFRLVCPPCRRNSTNATT